MLCCFQLLKILNYLETSLSLGDSLHTELAGRVEVDTSSIVLKRDACGVSKDDVGRKKVLSKSTWVSLVSNQIWK